MNQKELRTTFAHPTRELSVEDVEQAQRHYRDATARGKALGFASNYSRRYRWKSVRFSLQLCKCCMTGRCTRRAAWCDRRVSRDSSAPLAAERQAV